MTDNFRAPQTPIRSTWNEARLLMRGRLTDKLISKYQRKGYYSHEFKEARRELMAKKKARRDAVRSGNFLTTSDGRLVYSPL